MSYATRIGRAERYVRRFCIVSAGVMLLRFGLVMLQVLTGALGE